MRERYVLPETLEEANVILSKNDVEVLYSNEFVNPKTGKKTTRPKLGLWTLYWKKGFIGMPYNKDEEKKAKINAAVFILLWKSGLDVRNASELSSYFVEKQILDND